MPRQPTVSEQIAELQKKITLIEGDRKAFFQSSQYKIEKNSQKIQKLRKENKELHQRYVSTLNADEDAINETFGENHEEEKPAYRGKSTQEAIRTMNNKKCDALKRLNQQRYRTEEKKRELDETNNRIEQHEEDVKKAKDTEDGESETARRKRELENSLEKSDMKLQEAQNVTRTYEKIVSQLQQEKLTYSKQFDDMKQQIEEDRAELKDLKEMQTDAETSRDAAKAELQKQEEQLKKEKKEREEKLKELRKQAEEKKQQQDKMDRRLQSRSAIPPEQDQSSSGEKNAETADTEKKISTYEEAFHKIKETTGVSDTQEVVERFRNQDDTYNNLENQKVKNQETLEKLASEKEKVKEEYTAMKYTGETKLSHGERTLEEANNFLDSEEQRKEKIEERLKDSSGVLVSVKSGVEHLSIKVGHLKGSKSQEPKQTPSEEQEDYVLDLLMDCEDKLQKLVGDLGDKNHYEDVTKEQEGDSFNHIFEDKLPQYNTRVIIPSTSKENAYDEVESGEDEEVMTRASIKKQAQLLVDSKNKRRQPKKKKTKGK